MVDDPYSAQAARLRLRLHGALFSPCMSVHERLRVAQNVLTELVRTGQMNLEDLPEETRADIQARLKSER